MRRLEKLAFKKRDDTTTKAASICSVDHSLKRPMVSVANYFDWLLNNRAVRCLSGFRDVIRTTNGLIGGFHQGNS